MGFSTTFAPPVEGLAGAVQRWTEQDLMRRLWAKDPTVWFDPPRPEIDDRLGWLDLPSSSERLIPQITDLARSASEAGIVDLVLCGMGGSSLAPEVFAETLPVRAGHPKLTVIDSTHPDAVAAVAAKTDPATTWYLISSKSGGTLETLSLFRYFWSLATASVDEPGSHFIAVTDPASSLEALAGERGFRATVLADPNVGGRYSALSAFGLVPAGIIGADVRRLLAAGREAAARCLPSVPLDDNPAFVLGTLLGSRAAHGRDIVEFVASDPVRSLPMWIEQLVAESTGKDGVGIIPVTGGNQPTRGAATIVGVGSAPVAGADVAMRVTDPHDIAGAMFVLELATAIAGQVLGIQPFDQPDVQLAKTLAHQAMSGDLPASEPGLTDGEDPHVASSFLHLVDDDVEYISVQAYVAPTAGTDEALDALAAALVRATGKYVTVGYGPRFLHSTGQLHKGGPDSGAFLQLLDTPEVDLDVPETAFTFGKLISGQAAGDRAALAERGRRIVAVPLRGSANHAIGRLALAVGDTRS